MSRAIWKFPLAVTDSQTITIPRLAEILTVDVQVGGLMLWALVHPDAATVERQVRIYGTGNPIDPDDPMGSYVGSVLTTTGFVWHVYVEGDPL